MVKNVHTYMYIEPDRGFSVHHQQVFRDGLALHDVCFGQLACKDQSLSKKSMLAWHMYGRELYRQKKALIEMDGRGTYVTT